MTIVGTLILFCSNIILLFALYYCILIVKEISFYSILDYILITYVSWIFFISSFILIKNAAQIIFSSLFNGFMALLIAILFSVFKCKKESVYKVLIYLFGIILAFSYLIFPLWYF